MTHAVIALTIHIDGESGGCFLSAPDAEAEGHLWAIPRRPITIDQAMRAAAELGVDATEGVNKALARALERAESRASTLEAAVERARVARETADALRLAIG